MSIQEELVNISDISAERSVLSLILQHQELIYEVFSKLTPEDFFNVGNRIIARIIKLYFLEKNTIGKLNVDVLADILVQENLLNKVGGYEYLEALSILKIPRENLDYYIKRVKFCAVKRRLYEAAKQIQDEALNTEDTEDISAFIAEQENKIHEVVVQESVIDDIHNLADVVSILEQEEQNLIIPTLFPALDKELGGGFEGGKLYTIGARSKGFKSTTLLNFAVNIGVKQNIPVLYLDTEMDTRSQQRRLLAIVSNVPERHIRQKNLLTPEEKRRINEALKLLEGKKIFHKLLPGFSVEQIVSYVKRFYLTEGIRLLIFDYIKMPSNYSGKLQERQLLGVITSALKDIASELNIPVLTACQLNRQAVGKEEYDETFVAESDRILWFTDYLFYQRRKTEEEIQEHGRENGNFILWMGPCRYGGNYIGWFEILPSMRLVEIKNVDLDLDSLFV